MDWQYEDGRIYNENPQGELMAETTFIRNGNGEINIDHTYVNPALRGQGVAGKMMAVVAEYLREQGHRVMATCSYANVWLKKNRDAYADIISESLDEQNAACSITGRR